MLCLLLVLLLLYLLLLLLLRLLLILLTPALPLAFLLHGPISTTTTAVTIGSYSTTTVTTTTSQLSGCRRLCAGVRKGDSNGGRGVATCLKMTDGDEVSLVGVRIGVVHGRSVGPCLVCCHLVPKPFLIPERVANSCAETSHQNS